MTSRTRRSPKAKIRSTIRCSSGAKTPCCWPTASRARTSSSLTATSWRRCRPRARSSRSAPAPSTRLTGDSSQTAASTRRCTRRAMVSGACAASALGVISPKRSRTRVVPRVAARMAVRSSATHCSTMAVATAVTAVLTRLLPTRSVVSRREGDSSRRPMRRAAGSPESASRRSRMRLSAIKAVSEPEKKAETRSSPTSMAIRHPVSGSKPSITRPRGGGSSPLYRYCQPSQTVREAGSRGLGGGSSPSG